MTLPDWHHLPENPYNPHAWFVGESDIGEDCWIGAFTVIDGSGGLSIGRGCDISAGAQIYSHSTVRRVVSAGAVEIERAATRIGSPRPRIPPYPGPDVPPLGDPPLDPPETPGRTVFPRPPEIH